MLKDRLTSLQARAASAWAVGRTRTQQGWRWTTTKIRSVNWRMSPKVRRRAAWTGGIVGGSLLALILFLGLVDWNYLKGPVEGVMSARAGRTVTIEGDLDVKLLSWSPGATLEGLRIANPEWAGEGDMAHIERLAVKVKLLPLFKGDVVLPLLQVDKPVVVLARLEDGRNNWTFGRGRDDAPSLPPIRRFEINNGHLTINDDQRRLVFRGLINSSEIQNSEQNEGFQLTGEGTLNNEPFDMDLTGGPLLNVDPRKPYPFIARIQAGDTLVRANGSIARPFDLAVFDTTLAISGSDLADLYYLTGLALPNTPPYEVTGRLARRTAQYTYDDIDGRFGDSDLHGMIGVRTGGERVLLTGDLRSDSLDFDDLAALLGGGAATTPGADASPEQAQAAQNLAATQRLFPATPLRVERLRSMDAEVKYVAAAIVSENFPIRAGSVEVSLDNGLLQLAPLTFDLDQGRISGPVTINARQDIPAVGLDLRLTGAQIGEFLPATYKGAITGSLLGRAQLSGSGLSVREAAGSANGQFTLVIPEGQMRESLAEMLGVNILRGLFTDPEEVTTLRCAVADFKVTGGIMTAQTIVLDTDPVIVTGGGTVSLKTERMALTVKGHPKEARFVRLSIPIDVTGPIRKPSLTPDTSTALAQGGIGAALAALVSPLALILPFVDAGLAEDANCAGLINRAGSGNPAPVEKTAGTAQPRGAG